MSRDSFLNSQIAWVETNNFQLIFNVQNEENKIKQWQVAREFCWHFQKEKSRCVMGKTQGLLTTEGNQLIAFFQRDFFWFLRTCNQTAQNYPGENLVVSVQECKWHTQVDRTRNACHLETVPFGKQNLEEGGGPWLSGRTKVMHRAFSHERVLLWISALCQCSKLYRGTNGPTQENECSHFSCIAPSPL